MARQPIEKLQGYGQTSAPSAAPIDSYTGAPQVSRETPAKQLADALGTMSSAIARAGARDKAKKQQMADEKFKAYAATFKGEKDGDVLSLVKAKELHAQASVAGMADVIQTKYNNKSYTEAKADFLALDDDIKYSTLDLEAYLASKRNNISESYEGKDFVQSGYLAGYDRALNEFRPIWAAQQDAKLREQDVQNIGDTTHQVLSKYDTTTDQGLKAATEALGIHLDKSINTSVLDNTTVNQSYVDAIISHAKLNPSANSIAVISGIKFLNNKTTQKKLDEAAPIIFENGIGDVELNNKKIASEIASGKIDIDVNIDSMMADGNQDGVRAILAEKVKEDASQVEKGLHLYRQKAAKVALESEYVDLEASGLEKGNFIEALKLASTTGDYTKLGFSEGYIPNNAEIREKLALNTSLHRTDKRAISDNLESLRQGYTSIGDVKLRSFVDKTFQVDIARFGSEMNGRVLGQEKINAQQFIQDAYINTMKEGLDAHYDNPDYKGGIPQGTEMADIREKAYEAAVNTINKIDAVLNSGKDNAAAVQALKAERVERVQNTEQQLDVTGNFTVGEEYENPDDGKMYRLTNPNSRDKSSWELVEDLPDPEEVRVNNLELKQQQADELIDSTGMDVENFSKLLFKKMHGKYGDGFRLPMTIAERSQFNGLNLTDDQLAKLEEDFVNSLASEFINNMAQRRANTFDTGEQSTLEEYAKEVMNDPYKVFEYDNWLEGDMDTSYPGTGKDAEDILKLARQKPWFDTNAKSSKVYK